MRTFNILIRRTHLYLALICLPWFLMYGVTAIAFNHVHLLSEPDDLYNLSSPTWTKGDSFPAQIEVPPEGRIPQEVAAEILRVAGIEADAYGAFRLGGPEVNAYLVEFWRTRRAVYDPRTQSVTLYERKFFPWNAMRSMHSRAGYRYESFANDAWAVMVDVTMVGILLWVASGLYMWWQQKQLRKWGLVALIAGVGSFATIVWKL